MYRAFTALSFASLVLGQQVGTTTPEQHPSLPIQVCTAPGACTTEDTTVVLDVSIRLTKSSTPRNDDDDDELTNSASSICLDFL